MTTTITKFLKGAATGVVLVTLIALFIQGCKDTPKEVTTGTGETVYTTVDESDVEFYQRLTDLSRYSIIQKDDGYWAYVKTSEYTGHEISWKGRDTKEEALEDVKAWMDKNGEKLRKAKVGTVIVWEGSKDTLN